MREPQDVEQTARQFPRLFFMPNIFTNIKLAESGYYRPHDNNMRCKNCGWPNKPGETTCVKCNAPLDVESGAIHETTLEARSSTRRVNINATIPESSIFATSTPEEMASNEMVCPKCGYPLRPEVTKCPNCNYDVTSLYKPKHESISNQEVTHMDNPNNLNKVKGTINPYMIQEASAPTFVLKPVERIGEKKALSSLEYEGEEVILNRDNTEPGNESITSHVQAVIVNNNGRWFIENKSDLGTTFVKVSKKYELEEGDLILLGNRLFEFHIPEE